MYRQSRTNYKSLILILVLVSFGCIANAGTGSSTNNNGPPLKMLHIHSKKPLLSNKKPNFRGIQFGSNYSKHERELVPVESKRSTSRNANIYKRQGDKMNLKGAKLQYIHYLYHNNKFTAVMIKLKKGNQNLKMADQALQKHFAKNRIINPPHHNKRKVYYNHNRHGEVAFTVCKNNSSSNCKVILSTVHYYKMMVHAYKKYERKLNREKQRKAKQGGF